MKKIILLLVITPFLLWNCGGAEKRAESPETSDSVLVKQEEVHGTEVKEVDISTPVDAKMAKAGSEVFELKCSSCHKLTDEKVVGPGWKGVTKRRKPTWIINMITNVDVMLAEDAEAQKMLEECLVRMPNQNISSTDARNLLELMRQNDSEK